MQGRKQAKKRFYALELRTPTPFQRGLEPVYLYVNVFWKEVSFTGGAGLFVAGLLLRNL